MISLIIIIDFKGDGMKILMALVFSFPLFGDFSKGKEVYGTYCANCHSINMSGGMGKDFNLVSYTRNLEDIEAYTANPSGNFRKFGYTSNAMPTLLLNGDQISDVATFIDSLQPFKIWMKKK